MATDVLPVPTILSILHDNNNNDSYMVDQNIEESAQRAKKRRLDHLTWEEKLQRKKLKNRVAAQTSRDRKKAKLEQMETAIQQLFTKNETILAECEKLREANKRLQAENAELHQRLQPPAMRLSMSKPDCRARARERINRIPPSAERNGRGHSSGFDDDDDAPGGAAPEDGAGLPSLPDLLDELETDAEVDLNALEQLAHTLLEDIARDLESAAQKAADQESTVTGTDNPREVVGASPEQLEPRRSEVLDEKKSLEPDVSEYLLLHHNYAKKHPKETTMTPRCRRAPGGENAKKLKTIRPKVGTKAKLAIDKSNSVENKVIVQDNNPNRDIMYGTFDENTNTITILVNEDSTPLNEVVLDENILSTIPVVIDTSNALTAPKSDVGSLSPRSDLGYESVDSPLSTVDMDWDQMSVSELFPSLF